MVPDIAAAILSPQTISVTTDVAPAAAGEAADNPANPPPQIASVSVPGQDAGSSYVTLVQNGAGTNVALPAQVRQQLNQQVDQKVDQKVDQQVDQALQAAQAQILQACNHVTVIQNSLDNQIIQNMTTLNVTLPNAAPSLPRLGRRSPQSILQGFQLFLQGGQMSLRFVQLTLLFHQLEVLRRDLLAQLGQIRLGCSGSRTWLLHGLSKGRLRTQHHQAGACPGSLFLSSSCLPIEWTRRLEPARLCGRHSTKRVIHKKQRVYSFNLLRIY